LYCCFESGDQNKNFHVCSVNETKSTVLEITSDWRQTCAEHRRYRTANVGGLCGHPANRLIEILPTSLLIY